MRYSKIWISILLLSIYAFSASAQESETEYFEGTLEFDVQFSGPVADQIKLNEPNNHMQMHLKDGSYIINLKGGRYPKVFMYVNKDDVEYTMDPKEKAAYKYSSYNDLNKKNKEVPEARFTGKTAEVNGMVCQVYQMKKDNTYFTFFVNDDYRINTALYEGKKGAKPSFLIKGLDGRIPLKTIKKQSGLTVITTCKTIKPNSFDEEQFVVPVNFEVRKRDYRQ